MSTSLVSPIEPTLIESRWTGVTDAGWKTVAVLATCGRMATATAVAALWAAAESMSKGHSPVWAGARAAYISTELLEATARVDRAAKVSAVAAAGGAVLAGVGGAYYIRQAALAAVAAQRAYRTLAATGRLRQALRMHGTVRAAAERLARAISRLAAARPRRLRSLRSAARLGARAPSF
jgi:hypothetical protein